ncbi:hypothetical protein [Paenibacillus apiarius]|uniref:Uncharacterized protein n=1 Tax=Paenibacillus apiarius TaxID=46240 RepID=A0ABT4DX09_9BACL|nr:hypothetical protein [Paenibacillus apiarius]MCY9515420.1 hypothetical protein [Paenibacillus apiarius]MCY9521876.1 hypothetical protein [Paenibacillus apiarius]MCY9550269.1 hypothetical protein [Paenibacillus apiarius]MCY9559545.1 hypothetical protein [Paenibacillus apiarius]MCY9686837.1 hypothetical protein [Paenibacillus apiarius]
MGNVVFEWDGRLGIEVPVLHAAWESLHWDERSAILAKWEEIRGMIPDRIKVLERDIVAKQNALYDEEQFEASCRLNSEIAELASIINDLHLWYNIHQEMDAKIHH